MNYKIPLRNKNSWLFYCFSRRFWYIKVIYLGRFNDEIKAAKSRDKATKEYYGEYGNLNFDD